MVAACTYMYRYTYIYIYMYVFVFAFWAPVMLALSPKSLCVFQGVTRQPSCTLHQPQAFRIYLFDMSQGQNILKGDVIGVILDPRSPGPLAPHKEFCPWFLSRLNFLLSSVGVVGLRHHEGPPKLYSWGQYHMLLLLQSQ